MEPQPQDRSITVVETWSPHTGEEIRLVQPAQASSDDQLLALWLHGRPAHTSRAYAGDVARFLAFTGCELRQTTLGDVQAFADQLVAGELASATRARMLAAVKSLLAFAHRVGYVPFDIGRPVRLPSVKATLAERILPEADVQRMLALEPDPRNAAMLRLLYAGGLRVSELCALAWRDLASRETGGQVTVYGKGGKTRAVLIPAGLWESLEALRDMAGADPNAPVFLSRKGGQLTDRQVRRLVAAAATRAGIAGDVSPHWLRHAHASHALDRGAPIHLVQATLGHASVETTSRYTHARPDDSSSRYLTV